MLNIINFSYLITILLSALAALVAIIAHEISHGYCAYLLGDPTAKQSGRLSLNPLKHLDLIGVLCLIFFHIGWAKPVPINPYLFKKRKSGIILVSLAGPFSNFILAFLSVICMCLFYNAETVAGGLFYQFFYLFSAINIGLGIFNLIPVPPLDGSKVLAQFLPIKASVKYLEFERFGGIVLLLLIYVFKLSDYLNIALMFVFNALFQLVAGVLL